MAKTKKEKKEKKAGKRMKKKELVKALLDFFHVKQDEVLSLKYIFEQQTYTPAEDDKPHVYRPHCHAGPQRVVRCAQRIQAS